MPVARRAPAESPTPDDRRSRVAGILALGLLRRARRARVTGLVPSSGSCPQPSDRLAISSALRLSVPVRTGG